MSSTTVSPDTVVTASDESFSLQIIVQNFIKLLEEVVVPWSATIATVEKIATFLGASILDTIIWAQNKDIVNMTIAFYSIVEKRKGGITLTYGNLAGKADFAKLMNSPGKPAEKALEPYKTYPYGYVINVKYRNCCFGPLLNGKITPLVYKFLSVFIAKYTDLPYESTLQVVGYAFDDLEMETTFLTSLLPAPEGITVINEKSWPSMEHYLDRIKSAIGTLACNPSSRIVPEVLATIIEEIRKIPGAEACLVKKLQLNIDSPSISESDIVKLICVSKRMGLAVDHPKFMIYAPTVDESCWPEYVKKAYRGLMLRFLLEKFSGEDRYVYHTLVVVKMIEKYSLLHKGSMVDYLETFMEHMKPRIPNVPQEVVQSAIEKFILESPKITPENTEVLKNNLDILIRVCPDAKICVDHSWELAEYLGTVQIVNV